MVFGIKETHRQLAQKVASEDNMLSFEMKRKIQDRRCEFWLEFDNGVRMFAEMLDAATPAVE
jgi:hypothetical protein